jgi:hypothetical protein
MARTSLNAGLKRLSGAIDGWVYKQYDYGTVITRRPDMSGVKPSAKQLTHRENVRRAGEFHRRGVLSNPALLEKFTAIARRKGIPVSAVSLSEYLKAVPRKEPAGAQAGSRTGSEQPRYRATSKPEPKLKRFIAEHRRLQRTYDSLSKRELVQIVMRAEMSAADAAK